jgi:hypothetical protein
LEIATRAAVLLERAMDIEDERRRGLADARENHALEEGETLEARFGPGTYGEHELLDRASLMLSNWETFIVEHPATLLDPERYRKACEVAAMMAEFYQWVGRGPGG